MSERKTSATKPKPKQYRLRRGVDLPFLTVIILLVCAGIVMVATASYVYAGNKFGDNLHFLKRHVLYVALGLFGMYVMAHVPYETLRRFTPVIFLAAFALLGLVLFGGADYNGARRWLQLGPVSIQPSEIMKFAVIVACADYIDRFQTQITLKGQPGSFVHIVFPFLLAEVFGAVFATMGVAGAKIGEKLGGSAEATLSDGSANKFYGFICFCNNFKVLLILAGLVLLTVGVVLALRRNMAFEAPDFTFGVLPFGLLIVAIGVLLVLEPHMSGFIIITALIVVMMTIGGSSGRYILGAVCVGSGAVFALLNALSHSKGRLDIWKDPFSNIQGDGWQPVQSLYAIGNGGLWGVGIGQSRQKQMYLPEPMNDYIFAILCEEFGFIGALAVIALFVFFVYRGIVIACRAPDRFSALVVIGIVTQVGLQALLNMMVVTNTIPSTGISLPFFSYGGSSLIILLAEVGVVLSISRYSVIEKQ